MALEASAEAPLTAAATQLVLSSLEPVIREEVPRGSLRFFWQRYNRSSRAQSRALYLSVE
eukprot:4182-Heterococcus_DN1.PRE.2